MLHAVQGGIAQRLFTFSSAVSKSDADQVDTTLRSFTLPVLGINDALEIVAFWTYPNSATVKSLRTKIGPGPTIIAQHDVSTSNTFVAHHFLLNRGVQNSQIGARATQTVIGAGGAAWTASAIDFSQAQTLLFTAAWGTAGAGSNNITLEAGWVNILRG